MLPPNIWSLEGITHIGPKAQERLQGVGISSYHGMVTLGPLDVNEVTQIGRDKAYESVAFCKEQLLKAGKLTKDFRTGVDVRNSDKTVLKLSTGNHVIDHLMKGGFAAKKIFEAYGEFGSGKTQLGFTLAVNCQIPVEQGGLDGDVIFIDTENTFAPDRITEIAIGRGYAKDDDEATLFLNRINVARAYNVSHQRLLVQQIDELITQREKLREKNPKLRPFKLVIMDSAVALLRAEYQGQGKLANKWQHLGHMMNMLKRISETYNLVVFVTNQVYDDITITYGEKKKPSGGNYMAHTSSYRFFLKKSGKADMKGQKGIIRMVDSPEHANFEMLFLLSDKEGFSDVKEEKEEKAD